MAGSLFGLGLSQQFYNAAPAAGALLYVYAANTSTPSTTYSDFGLSVTQTNPIVADGDGRLPQIWVADGSYRVRLTTSTGVTIFDESSVTAIGSSSTGAASAGSVDSTTIFATGDTLWVPIAGTRSGWVRANGRTLGSGSSGATERANADTSALYAYLWNNYSNTICAVSSGRGANAAADFAANKTITLLDLRGRAPVGLDDMGNSAASNITAGTPTAAATTGGTEKPSITIAQGNLPNVNLSAASLTWTQASATIKFNTATNTATSGSGTRVTDILSSGANTDTTGVTITGTLGGNVPLGGSGTALTPTTTPPYMLGSWYLKL